MEVKLLKECGYDEAVLGFSLSYNTTIERTMEILPKYAFGKSGENKFLECIQLWIDITAPRYWYQEFDTYRIGVTKQSESTMHTLCKKLVTIYDFEIYPYEESVDHLNDLISGYKATTNKDLKKIIFGQIKSNLPEGYLQRRIVNLNYKSFMHMYEQRIDHRLPQWQYFLNTIMSEIQHPEFIVKESA